MIAFVLLLGFFFVSRTIGERASKKLDQEKKASLIDLFSDGRAYSYVILISIIVLFFANLKFDLIDPSIGYVIYGITLTIYLGVTSYSTYNKLKQNAFPDFYIKAFLLSTFVRFVGLIIFFALIGI